MKDNPNIMNVREAAAYIQVSEMCMYRLLKRKQVPGAFRVGASHRVRKDILDARFAMLPEERMPQKPDRRFKHTETQADRDFKDRSTLDENGN